MTKIEKIKKMIKHRFISINEGRSYKWYGSIHIYLDKYLFVFSIQPPFTYKAFRFTCDFNGGYQ